MSHTATWQSTTLAGVSQELVQQAIAIAAEKMGLQLSVDITEYRGGRVTSWENRPFVGAVRGGPFHYGIGVVIDEAGKMRFVYEAMERGIQDFVKEVEQAYLALSLAMAVAALGYRVKSVVNDAVAIKGEKE